MKTDIFGANDFGTDFKADADHYEEREQPRDGVRDRSAEEIANPIDPSDESGAIELADEGADCGHGDEYEQRPVGVFSDGFVEHLNENVDAGRSGVAVGDGEDEHEHAEAGAD